VSNLDCDVVALAIQHFDLTKDDGEFYQFCCVAASGPVTNEETNTVLEDQLKKANEVRAELRQVTKLYFLCFIDILSYFTLYYRIFILVC